MNIQKKLIDRFFRYVKVDTQSDASSTTVPTTKGQLKLANMLVEELKEIGMTDVSIDAKGYVMATLEGNNNKNTKTIGFLAHLDTATEITGQNVQPILWEAYKGEDLLLNEEENRSMRIEEHPSLQNYIHKTLITTDGTTLLGADNKAGIAEIITAMEYLITHPEIKHGPIRIAFTPDEEIGRGPLHFDVEKFAADFAYTVDGGPLGELQYESFYAAEALLTCKGYNVHPGTAKSKLIHAAKIAMEFHRSLPEQEAPEYTENYEGFYHLLTTSGTVEEASSHYLIRDFDRDNFNKRKQLMEQITRLLKQKYGDDTITLEINDQYYNMREKIEPVFEIVEIAQEAMKNLHIEPIIEPIRGGTDGSQLSFMGLPTPNIFTGGENFHSRYEFIALEHMEKAVQVIVEICRLYNEKHS